MKPLDVALSLALLIRPQARGRLEGVILIALYAIIALNAWFDLEKVLRPG